jgi:CubicO group peptidase (beta-lactamase class C family)
MIEDGKLNREYYSSANDLIDKDTVFSTASMSKWLTAVGVMKLVENGELDLDTPIADELTRWSLPASEFDNNEVTTRRLLSHTAGLNDGLGFGDYRPEEPVPTLEQSLAKPRASTERDVNMAVQLPPGSEFIYSGGGYLILQLLVEEVSGIPFEDFIQKEIFDILPMDRST